MYNPDEAYKFIKALTGSESTPVHFQCYFDPDKKLGLKPDKNGYATEWYDTLENSLDLINDKQDSLCGVFVCVNETNGEGREESDIIGLRAFVVDFDGQAEPEWVLQPHLIDMRDATHGHAFWLIETTDESNDEWSIMQRRLALFYDTDTQVVDPCRVIRLPGSGHFKNPDKPAEYFIMEDHSETLPKYSFSDVREAHTLTATLDADLNKWAEARQGIADGTGLEFSQHEANRFTNFISYAAHPAVEGSGTHELYRVALFGRDHGLPFEDAVNLLWEHYNPRCEPPWSEDEFDEFEGVCFRAYKYAVSTPGCKTLKSALQSLKPLVEPDCGWDGQREKYLPPEFKPSDIEHVKTVKFEDCDIDREHRLSREESEVVSCQLTGKSSHYRFAESFDGLVYDGINLIRNDGQFYRYEGLNWSLVKDEVIKAQIQRAFKGFEPSDSLTNGILNVYKSFVSREHVENGTFLSNPEKDTTDLAVFQNCIAKLTGDTVTTMKHTPDFFNLNALAHNYNPNAKCDTWINFLDSIWGDDEDLKTQLQMWFGYCLTSDVSLEKFAIFKGKSRGGKGVITTILNAMVGEANVCAPTLDKIHKDSSLEEMANKSLCFIPEAHDLHLSIRDSVLSILKSITGGDKVSYHKMYVGSQNSVFKIKVMISTNNVPNFQDPSGALMNRGLVFPFWNSFAGKEDYTLKPRLIEEIEGITLWAIEGLKMLRANGNKFVESKRGLEDKKEIREDMNPLALFFVKMCDFDENEESTVDELYNAYRLWTVSVGNNKPANMVKFRQMVRNSNVAATYYERGSERGFKGLVLKHDVVSGNVIRGTFGKVI